MADVDICNLALIKLGDPEQLTSLSANNKLASLFRTVYPAVRKSELRRHSWNFAKTYAELAADGTAPAFGFNYRYLLPAGFLRLPPQQDANKDWQITGGYIYTDDPAPLEIVYIRDEEDTGLWDVLFQEAVAAKLALEMAAVRTASNTRVQLAADAYTTAIREAKRINAIENPPQDAVEDDWVSVRRPGFIPVPPLDTGSY